MQLDFTTISPWQYATLEAEFGRVFGKAKRQRIARIIRKHWNSQRCDKCHIVFHPDGIPKVMPRYQP